MLALAQTSPDSLLEISCMPELKSASIWDIQVWTKAEAYLQLNLNNCAFDKQCTNDLRIVQKGNRFEIHSSVIILPGMTLNDVLYAQDGKASAYHSLNCTLKEITSQAKYAGFHIAQCHELSKTEVQSFLDNLGPNSQTVKMPISPLVLELGESGRAFFRKLISENPTGCISEASFDLFSNKDHYKFRFNFYSERDEVLKRIVKSGYAVSFEFQNSYPEVFTELKSAAALGLINRMCEIAAGAGFTLTKTPNLKQTETALKAHIIRFAGYTVELMDKGVLRKLSTKNGLISVEMLTSLNTDFKTLQNRAEQCSKRMLDRLVKASLIDGCTYISSEQKLIKRSVSTAFDSEFTEISFCIDNERRLGNFDDGLPVGSHNSRRLNIKLKIRDGGAVNIIMKNEDGSHVDSSQGNLLKKSLKVKCELLKHLNREEVSYLISKQLNSQYRMSWIIIS